jgi:hypothetical protein
MVVLLGGHLSDPEARAGPVAAAAWGQEIPLVVQLLQRAKAMLVELEKPISIMGLVAVAAGLVPLELLFQADWLVLGVEQAHLLTLLGGQQLAQAKM